MAKCKRLRDEATGRRPRSPKAKPAGRGGKKAGRGRGGGKAEGRAAAEVERAGGGGGGGVSIGQVWSCGRMVDGCLLDVGEGEGGGHQVVVEYDDDLDYYGEENDGVAGGDDHDDASLLQECAGYAEEDGGPLREVLVVIDNDAETQRLIDQELVRLQKW